MFDNRKLFYTVPLSLILVLRACSEGCEENLNLALSVNVTQNLYQNPIRQKVQCVRNVYTCKYTRMLGSVSHLFVLKSPRVTHLCPPHVPHTY